jgi:hypothetical protein
MNNFLGHYFSLDRTRSRGKTSKTTRRKSIEVQPTNKPAKPAISITLKTGKPSRVIPQTVKTLQPIEVKKKPPIIIELN